MRLIRLIIGWFLVIFFILLMVLLIVTIKEGVEVENWQVLGGVIFFFYGLASGIFLILYDKLCDISKKIKKLHKEIENQKKTSERENLSR